MLLALPVVGPDQAHTEAPDTVAPKFVSARTDSTGETVIVTFSEDIFLSPLVHYVLEKMQIKRYQFPKAVMDVTVDGHDDVLTDWVFIRGNELWMSLSKVVSVGQEVKVSYDNIFARSGGGIFVDASGNPAPLFSFQAVTNNSTESTYVDRTPDFVLSVDELTIPEGGSAAYTVVLESQPTQDISVRVSPFKTLVTSVDLVSFTPDNWDTPQTVTVSTYTDDDPFDAWGIVHHYLEWEEDGYTVSNGDYWRGINVVVDDVDTPLPVVGNVFSIYRDGSTASVASYTVPGEDSTIHWSLLGEDSGRFSISDSGVLSFSSPPDYENPSDTNTDNVYELFVDATTDSSVGFLPVFVTVIPAAVQHGATGAPSISGPAQVGRTLTAGTSGISDADGLTNVSYSYQWLADDTEIDGATSSTYTLQASDNGKVIKVRVTFIDDAGNRESLTSEGTPAVVMGGL